MSETKLRGFAAMTPERRKEIGAKARASRAANRANRASGVVAEGTDEKDLRRALNDKNKTHDVLDRFRYSKDPKEVAIWRTGKDFTPVDPPTELKKKYPELEWKLLSKKKTR